MKSLDNKIIFGILSGWGAQAVSIVLGILTMPLFFRYLPMEELGLWMFFIGTAFFVNLADLGFSPVMGRQLAFALGDGDKNANANYTCSSYYFRLAKYVASITAPVLFIGMLLIGSIFLWTLPLPEELFIHSLVAWAIFSL
jgi:O-antigen/teichoic acid export membrane protein